MFFIFFWAVKTLLSWLNLLGKIILKKNIEMEFDLERKKRKSFEFFYMAILSGH